MKTHISKLEEQGFCHAAQSVYIHVGQVNLGNNFTYRHFIKAIDKDELRGACAGVSIEDSVTIIGHGNFGPVMLRTCASDLFDHIR